jgi:hypothetical protein
MALDSVAGRVSCEVAGMIDRVLPGSRGVHFGGVTTCGSTAVVLVVSLAVPLSLSRRGGGR